MAPTQGGNRMRHVGTAADRIDYWIRRHIVPCAAQNNTKTALDRDIGLTAIGCALRAQYDAHAAPVPPYLAALIKQLDV